MSEQSKRILFISIIYLIPITLVPILANDFGLFSKMVGIMTIILGLLFKYKPDIIVYKKDNNYKDQAYLFLILAGISMLIIK